ncbi:MAG: hypothetical protein H7175_00255 [Burkholderiales bacterium]|nr:hypothetical protein [Anaerolineae bacterium]
MPSALTLSIGGGLLALTFLVLVQLIDVQLSMNHKLRQHVKHLENDQSQTQRRK